MISSHILKAFRAGKGPAVELLWLCDFLAASTCGLQLLRVYPQGVGVDLLWLMKAGWTPWGQLLGLEALGK